MYSQHEEELYILAAAGEASSRFLDIGAYDGFHLSNTLALYERGWSGVLVEPAPGPFSALQDRYAGGDGRATLVHAAIALEAGLVELFGTDDALSTFTESHAELWKDIARYRKFWVQTTALRDLLAAFPGPYDFVSIDTEGTSCALAMGLLGVQSPRVMCVELDRGMGGELLNRASVMGYRPVYRNGENVILVKGQA